MKKVALVLLGIIFLIGSVVAVGYFWYKGQLDEPASDSSQLVEVEIEQGESVQDIAVKLQTAGVIKSSDVFYLYVKLENLGSTIQAGKFKLPQNLTVKEVVQVIQKAAGNDIWITIPEGLRYDQIADLLDEAFLQEEGTTFVKEDFLDIVENPDDYSFDIEILEYKPEGKGLEGFLFPDTYNVKKDISSMEIVNLLVKTLEKKLVENNVTISSHKTLSAYEVIILASIIEREALGDEEMYMVSDILQKRLNGELDGVKLLQADATLLYELKDWEAVITNELKEKDSPYNTYKKTGLPPTAICNPGLVSIQSVMNPKDNDYFYYLHDPEGQIHYSKTLDEHENNRRCYIAGNQDYCI